MLSYHIPFPARFHFAPRDPPVADTPLFPLALCSRSVIYMHDFLFSFPTSHCSYTTLQPLLLLALYFFGPSFLPPSVHSRHVVAACLTTYFLYSLAFL